MPAWCTGSASHRAGPAVRGARIRILLELRRRLPRRPEKLAARRRTAARCCVGGSHGDAIPGFLRLNLLPSVRSRHPTAGKQLFQILSVHDLCQEKCRNSSSTYYDSVVPNTHASTDLDSTVNKCHSHFRQACQKMTRRFITRRYTGVRSTSVFYIWHLP